MLVVLLLAGFLANNTYAQSIKGEGPVVKQEIQLDAFTAVGLSGSGNVYIERGSTQKVVVEAQQNIIDHIKREVKNGSWNIGFDKNVRNYDKLNVYITIPTVKGLSIAGSGKIMSKSDFNDLDKVDFSISGSGTIEFSGSAKMAQVSIAGSGDVKAENFKAEECKVSISGSGDCFVDVAEMLNVSIAGSGDVHYKGRPRVKSSIAGSGNLKSMD